VRRDLALVAGALLLLGAAAYGPQVANGGLYWDDWQNAMHARFGGPLDAPDRPVFGYRPVLTILLTLQYEALGASPVPLLALAALFGVSTSWALYLVLRTLGFGREAFVPALLLLVFPWTDSTRMWNTASFDTLAVTFYLLGLVAAIHGLRTGRRPFVAASAALYLAAAWTYEILAVAVLFSVAVYLIVAPRRAALRRFGLDALIAAIAIGLVALGTTREPIAFGDQVDHALTLASQSFSLLSRALFPFADLPGVVGAIVLVVAAAVALHGRRRTELRLLGVGALGVAAGYALFIPAPLHYEPLAPGTTNRMNVLAAVGFVLIVFAVLRVVGRRNALAVALLMAVVGSGYLNRVYDDQEGWERSARVQGQVLTAVRTSLPDPPGAATIYTFGAPSFVAPGIPSFSLAFDLRAAVRLEYDDASLSAYPVRGFDVMRCFGGSLHPVGGTYGEVHGARYGEAWFVNVPRRAAVRIDDAAECRRWARLLNAD
jgi:hypothetical protein